MSHVAECTLHAACCMLHADRQALQGRLLLGCCATVQHLISKKPDAKQALSAAVTTIQSEGLSLPPLLSQKVQAALHRQQPDDDDDDDEEEA